MITLGLLIILLVFFLISAAIVYHLWQYNPEKDTSTVLIGVYVIVSIVLTLFSVAAFSAIEWESLM